MGEREPDKQGEAKTETRQRDEQGRWLKGCTQKAGPGRPKGITLQQALDQVSDPMATAQLLEDFCAGRIKGTSPQTRLDALKYKIDRHLGRPKQQIEAAISSAEKWEELQRRAAEIRASGS